MKLSCGCAQSASPSCNHRRCGHANWKAADPTIVETAVRFYAHAEDVAARAAGGGGPNGGLNGGQPSAVPPDGWGTDDDVTKIGAIWHAVGSGTVGQSCSTQY